MTQPRKHQISLEDTPFYAIHCRCVRRSFIMIPTAVKITITIACGWSNDCIFYPQSLPSISLRMQ